jgi:hypothetical protein
LAGGGYNIQLDSTTSQDGVPPTDSVPLNGFAWTVNVTAHAIGLHVTAFAVCLDPDFPVVIETVKASSSGPDASVACPTGSILTGGGFTSGEGTNVASQPDGNGWKVSTAIPSGGSATSTAFALCATKGLKAGSVQLQTKTVAKGTVATNNVGCPPGQYPVGGGYNGYSPTGDMFWHVFLNGPDTGQGFVSSGWMAEVHSGLPADSAFTVYSICAAL